MVIVILRQHRPRCRPSSARSAGSHSSAFMTRKLTPLSKNSETMTGYYDNMVIGSWNKMQICSIQDTSQKKCPNQTILMIFFPGVRWKFLRWAILGRCWRSWHSGPEILVGGTKVFDEKRWETIDEIFDFLQILWMRYLVWCASSCLPFKISDRQLCIVTQTFLFLVSNDCLFVDHFWSCLPFQIFPMPAQTGKWEYEGAGAELIIFRFSYFQLQQPGSAKTTSPFFKVVHLKVAKSRTPV